MFKLLHNCTHLTRQQSNTQNSPSEASIVHEQRTSRFSSWIQKTQRNQRSDYQHPLGHRKSKRVPDNIYFCFIDYAKDFDYVHHNELWKIVQEMGIPAYLTCLLRNLCAGQEATVGTRHGTMAWFHLGKGIYQSVYCHPAYLTDMQSTSCELLGWMKHRLDSRLTGEISVTSDMQMTPFL